MAQKVATDWHRVENRNIFSLLLSPFTLYLKQFVKFYIISLIPEAFIFGIFWLIKIEVYYDFISRLFEFHISFRDRFSEVFVTPLLIFVLFLLLLRSAIITSMSWQTKAEGKTNLFWGIYHTFSLIKEIIIAAIIFLPFLLISGLIFVFSLPFGASLPGMMWFLIGIAVCIVIIPGSKICLFNVGITKDKLPIGTAFQKSWELTKQFNYIKTVLFLMIFSMIAIIIPYFITSYLNNTIGDWTGIIMIFVRALFYPLFDNAMTVLYIHSEHQSITNSVFREDILKQRERSEMLYYSEKKE